MKIKILGSGGGEGFPATFCTCAHCEMARKAGKKSLRTLSQTLINDDLLIDFPADTNAHCVQHGVNLGQLQHVLITHAHDDHYLPIAVNFRGGQNAHNLRYEKIHIFGPQNLEKVYDEVVSVYGIRADVRKNIDFVTLQGKQQIKIGNYHVTALSANHAPELFSLNYIIEDGIKSLLYLLDSGYPTDEVLTYLQSLKKPIDCVIMDGTMGIAPPNTYIYHMGFEENKLLKSEFLRCGIADINTRFVVNHITHNQAETHEKIEQIFAGTGIEVAYDGMEFEI